MKGISEYIYVDDDKKMYKRLLGEIDSGEIVQKMMSNGPLWIYVNRIYFRFKFFSYIIICILPKTNEDR